MFCPPYIFMFFVVVFFMGRRKTSAVNVFLSAFQTKLVSPANGVHSECVCAEHEAAGKVVDFDEASSSPDPGKKSVGECGKRLNESLWASEDLSCRSEIKQHTEATRGSPEQTAAADSHRAISLDAAECLAEMSSQPGTSLVRSVALEDLTVIEDRSLWENKEEEQIKDMVTAEGAELKFHSDFRSKNIPSETLEKQRLSKSGFDSHSEVLPPTHITGSISEKRRPFTKPSCDPEAENSSESSSHRASDSKPDISTDLQKSSVAQTSSQPLKCPSQSPAARRSLVPVAILKGLFAIILTSSEPALLQLTPSTCLIYICSFASLLCSTLSPNDFQGCYL